MADQQKKRLTLFLAFLFQTHGTSCIPNKIISTSVKTTRVVFSSNNFLGAVFLFLTVLLTQKAITNSKQQDCAPTGKALLSSKDTT